VVPLLSCSKHESRDAAPATAAAGPTAAAAGPAEHRAASPPEPSEIYRGLADLEFSGAIERTFKSAGATCSRTRLDGRDGGWSWALADDDLTFQIIVLEDEDFDDPSAIVTLRRPTRVTLVSKRGGRAIAAARDRSRAEIDCDLEHAGGRELVHVKGSMTCSLE